MPDQVTVRNVGPKQIYESYQGILRISPSDVDGSMLDGMTLAFTNPHTDANTQRKVILSDSNGNQIGLYFTAYVRHTDIITETRANGTGELVNVCSNVDQNVFTPGTYRLRSTLRVNKKGQTDRVSPIQVYRESPTILNCYDVVAYPVESPHDESYFNANNKLGLVTDFTGKKPPHQQVQEALHNKDRAWYDKNIPKEQRVTLAGKFIYTSNYKYEEVPIVYTKDYILGQYSGHTTRLVPELRNKYLGATVGKEHTVNGQSIFTKLSFFDVDKATWDVLSETTSGNIRHSEGRFTQLGIGMNESITNRLFGTENPPDKAAPILGLGVPRGVIMYSAMPFRRWMFYALRQQIRNCTDENNNFANMPAELKSAMDAGKITAFNKRDPGQINTLTKDYVLCNGYELNYTNYPYMNTSNEALFAHDDKGTLIRESNGKPRERTDYTGVFAAIKASSHTRKITIPSLLVTEQLSPRYLRGLNWLNDLGVDKPMDFAAGGVGEETFKDNDKKMEVVKDSDYGLTEKNYSTPGNYRFSIDWKACGTHHRHTCFAAIEEEDCMNNNNVNGNNINEPISIPVSDYQPIDGGKGFTYPDHVGEFIKGSQSVDEKGNGHAYWKRKVTHGHWFHSTDELNVNAHPVNMSTPATWSAKSGMNQKYATQLADYSFLKRKDEYLNTWDHHMPVPCAALFAWKLDNNSNVPNFQESKLNGQYVIQNAEQTPIASDKKKRARQLEMMNYAEGAIPISIRGGADILDYYVLGHCKNGHTLHSNGYHDVQSWNYGGQYSLQAVSSAIHTDVPRCTTSLPITDIWTKCVTETDPATGKSDPLTGQMGDKNIEIDDSLSTPPTIVMLPLFKL